MLLQSTPPAASAAAAPSIVKVDSPPPGMVVPEGMELIAVPAGMAPPEGAVRVEGEIMAGPAPTADASAPVASAAEGAAVVQAATEKPKLSLGERVANAQTKSLVRYQALSDTMSVFSQNMGGVLQGLMGYWSMLRGKD